MIKLRTIVVLAMTLVVAAVGAWMWFGNDGTPLPASDLPGLPDSPATARSEPARAVPGPPVLPTPSSSTATAAPRPTPTPPAAPVPITSSVVPGIPVGRGSSLPPRPAAAALPPGERPVSRPMPQAEGQTELESVQFMLRDYRARLGENPVGSNAEIMRAIMGGNAARANLGPPTGQNLNDGGELLDRWGIPYFFHQLSKENMEVRSAGPDQKMWTSDDLITR